jgi:hypothetical protein
MSDTLHFEATTHTYKLLPRGIELPSVSRLIQPLVDFSSVPKATLEYAIERGHAVHKACELFDLGTLDPDSVDPAIAEYVRAWALFMYDWKPEFTEIEQPGYHKTMLYAGTPDRWATWKDRRGQQRRILIDLKSTAKLNPAVAVQLSGYSLMADEPADELWSVRLMNDGTYERVVHKLASATFLSCYNIFMWKRKNA